MQLYGCFESYKFCGPKKGIHDAEDSVMDLTRRFDSFPLKIVLFLYKIYVMIIPFKNLIYIIIGFNSINIAIIN